MLNCSQVSRAQSASAVGALGNSTPLSAAWDQHCDASVTSLATDQRSASCDTQSVSTLTATDALPHSKGSAALNRALGEVRGMISSMERLCTPSSPASASDLISFSPKSSPVSKHKHRRWSGPPSVGMMGCSTIEEEASEQLSYGPGSLADHQQQQQQQQHSYQQQLLPHKQRVSPAAAHSRSPAKTRINPPAFKASPDKLDKHRLRGRVKVMSERIRRLETRMLQAAALGDITPGPDGFCNCEAASLQLNARSLCVGGCSKRSGAKRQELAERMQREMAALEVELEEARKLVPAAFDTSTIHAWA